MRRSPAEAIGAEGSLLQRPLSDGQAGDDRDQYHRFENRVRGAAARLLSSPTAKHGLVADKRHGCLGRRFSRSPSASSDAGFYQGRELPWPTGAPLWNTSLQLFFSPRPASS